MFSADGPEPIIGQIELFLRDALTAFIPAPPATAGRGRPRVLPSLCLWSGLLVCVLRGFSAQIAVWRLLTQTQLWFYPRFPVSDAAVYDRLARAGTAPLEQLFAQIRDLVAARLAPYLPPVRIAPWASAILALDETTVDHVARTLPALRDVKAGDDRLLPGTLTGLFDIRPQQWQHIAYHTDPHQNEKVAARTMVAQAPKGSLIVADLGYFGFAWFDWLTDHHYFWLSRLRAKTSYRIIHTFYAADDITDQLVWLGAYRSDQAAHAVRLVQFRVGTHLCRYVTNVTDPPLFPIVAIAQIYARRWDIELAFKTIKRHLHLHLLWRAKTGVILQQVWAVLIIAHILQAFQMEIAYRAAVDPFDVSLALLVQYLPEFAYTGRDPVAFFVERVRAARFIRPSTRTRIVAPALDMAHYLTLPPATVVTRKPHDAGKT